MSIGAPSRLEPRITHWSPRRSTTHFFASDRLRAEEHQELRARRVGWRLRRGRLGRGGGGHDEGRDGNAGKMKESHDSA